MSEPRILIATGLYPPDIGGPATYTKMLEAVLPPHGFSLTVVPFHRVRRLPKVIRHLCYFFILLWYAPRHNLIYALDPVSVGVPAWGVSVLTRLPLLIRLGGDYAWEQGQQRFGVTENLDQYTKYRQTAPRLVRVLATIQSFITRQATYVIVPSNYLKSIVRTWGVPEERIKVIYSVLHPLSVLEPKVDLRAKYHLTGTVVMTAARLVPWKGCAVLIDVIGQINATGQSVTLLIAGDGPEFASLTQQVADGGLATNVRFLGRLERDVLGEYLKASDVFVLNTSYEGLSHQLLEVMDLGVPIVTTNVGGNSELITDNMSGIMTSFNDAEAIKRGIIRLSTDESFRRTVTQYARIRTKDFDETVVVKQVVALLNNILY